MAKRTATRELNHDNWDDEEESEDAGTFQKATQEALQGRVIKQARRRLGASDEVIRLCHMPLHIVSILVMLKC